MYILLMTIQYLWYIRSWCEDVIIHEWSYPGYLLVTLFVSVGYVWQCMLFHPVLPPDTSLTPHTLLPALSTVRQFWEHGLLQYLGVPWPVLDQIRDSQSYSSEDEKRVAGLQYYLQTLPSVSWGRIASVLWYLEEHTALETVRQYLPHQHGEWRNVIYTV